MSCHYNIDTVLKGKHRRTFMDINTDIGNIKVINYPGEAYLVFGRHCRRVAAFADGRFHHWYEYVYDGRGIDIKTGISVKSKHWKSENGAKKHGYEELCRELHRRKII
eukprot:109354_1